MTALHRLRAHSAWALMAIGSLALAAEPADNPPITAVYNADVQPRPYDPAMAEQLLSDAGLTKNIDVTAGVRYKSDDRIEPLTDTRRDSQAVYVGTAFRF